MFDKLIDFLISWGEKLFPFFTIDQYQEAVLLRNGKFKKLCTAGLHMKVPFIDTYLAYHITITTINLPSQSLITKDKRDIVVKGMVKYKVSDVKTYLLEVFDANDAISDVTEGVIKQIVMSKTLDECTDSEIDNLITKKTRSEIKKFGVDIIQVTLTDIASIRTIRLMQDNYTNPGENVMLY